jgi:hypothetical protein
MVDELSPANDYSITPSVNDVLMMHLRRRGKHTLVLRVDGACV